MTPLAERGNADGAAVTPATPRSASGDQPTDVAERPGQLTIDAFPEWDGTLPVPYGVVPY